MNFAFVAVIRDVRIGPYEAAGHSLRTQVADRSMTATPLLSDARLGPIATERKTWYAMKAPTPLGTRAKQNPRRVLIIPGQ